MLADQIAGVWWPSIKSSEQRAIAHILGTLDDKIELNHRMCETLEAIARALFKSWFIDFNPVHAKCRGGPTCPPQKGQAQGPVPTQWPQHILDLFPSCFIDSELGEIPEGWDVGTLGDVVENLREQENPLEWPDVVYERFSIPAYDEGQLPKR